MKTLVEINELKIGDIVEYRVCTPVSIVTQVRNEYRIVSDFEESGEYHFIDGKWCLVDTFIHLLNGEILVSGCVYRLSRIGASPKARKMRAESGIVHLQVNDAMRGMCGNSLINSVETDNDVCCEACKMIARGMGK